MESRHNREQDQENQPQKPREEISRDPLNNTLEQQSSIPNDLPDRPEDREKLRAEETTIQLPDVKDIPGQEFVHVPPAGEMADDTIASADEEGERVFDEENLTDNKSNVSPDERHALERTDYLPTTDEDRLQRASMDNVDFQGEELNEKGFGEHRGDTLAPDDLDTNTAAGDETRTTSMGQGDEENKTYSLGSADNDEMNEGTP